MRQQCGTCERSRVETTKRRQCFLNRRELVSRDQATVKRVFREPGGVRLEAENAAYEPIRGTDISVIGRVVGVMRDL